MSPQRSERLLAIIALFISKNGTYFRSVSVTERLALTFQFFTTEDALQSLSFSYLHVLSLTVIKQFLIKV